MAIRKKVNQSNYRDGVALVFLQKEKESSFSARENVKDKQDLIYKGEVYFRNSYIRQQDINFMENQSGNIERKIVIRNCPLVKQGDKLEIDRKLYDIVRTDPDTQEQELYLYLELYRSMEA